MYGFSKNKNDKEGKRLILDEIDFSSNNLSQLNFVDVYITDSIFCNTVFENTNFGGAKLYGCEFNNITFKNVNFGKVELDASKIVNSIFDNCTLIKVSSNETLFGNLCFQHCKLDDVFSNSIVKNILFEECDFNGIEFWECIISSLKFKKSKFKVTDMKKNINKGTLERPVIINGDEAISFFKERSEIL
ncbi:pentapeptide repeat-containing protein [Bacillus aquiflavi]|nr:pentapeptide repeat-containing protein [Bacillus aquiflavi]